MLELGPYGGPVVLWRARLPRHGADSRHVDGVVDQAEAVVGLLVDEVVAVLFAERDNEVDGVQIGYGDLHRVSLDVNDGHPPGLQGVLELDHEQGTAFGHDVVDVTNIPKRIVEFGRGQSVNGVDDDFQGLGKPDRIFDASGI